MILIPTHSEQRFQPHPASDCASKLWARSPRANKFVENMSAGQLVCGFCDRKFVEKRRKSLQVGSVCDSLFVDHHYWCSTNFLSFSTNLLSRFWAVSCDGRQCRTSARVYRVARVAGCNRVGSKNSNEHSAVCLRRGESRAGLVKSCGYQNVDLSGGKKSVETSSAGQQVCGSRDKKSVETRRKSLQLSVSCDSLFVDHHYVGY